MKKPDVKVVILGDMNVGKTSLLHRYTERRFRDTVSTVGGAFYLKQWGPYNISLWDTAGRTPQHLLWTPQHLPTAGRTPQHLLWTPQHLLWDR